MGKTMTPSEQEITAGQIGKIQEILGAGLRKSGLQNEPTQIVLETQGDALVDELVAVVRRRVEMVSNAIIRRVKVDRTRTPQEMIDATGRRQYTDRKIVDSMPRGEGEEVDLHVFRPEAWEYDRDGYMSIAGLEAALKRRGLKADPYAQIVLNTVDPAFADEHPNGCQWDVEGNTSSFVTFDRWDDGRSVHVDRCGDDWDGRWGFAGSRKPA